MHRLPQRPVSSLPSVTPRHLLTLWKDSREREGRSIPLSDQRLYVRHSSSCRREKSRLCGRHHENHTAFLFLCLQILEMTWNWWRSERTACIARAPDSVALKAGGGRWRPECAWTIHARIRHGTPCAVRYVLTFFKGTSHAAMDVCGWDGATLDFTYEILVPVQVFHFTADADFLNVGPALL